MSIYHRTFPVILKYILGLLFVLIMLPLVLLYTVFLVLGIPLVILLYLPTLGWSWALVSFIRNEWKYSKDPDKSYFNRYTNSIFSWCFGTRDIE